MTATPQADQALFAPLHLPSGTVLKNRIVKSAMSDSLGDGRGNPTKAQMTLYRRWARGGVALSIVGEVQGSRQFAEKPGNLVLDEQADSAGFRALANAGSCDGAQLWLQLGQAGAMADPRISRPKGPSALDLPGLRADALTLAEIAALPDAFAATARRAERLGFGGVQIHAAHGFLLSQFLSPLFNRRGDDYGGTAQNRRRLLIEVVAAVRGAVGPGFAVGLKINATDQLQGGLDAPEALEAIADLTGAGLDLIDISGGTYFPGAVSGSDRAADGPYFADFANAAIRRTDVPLMVTGGIKTHAQAQALVAGPAAAVGLARALVLDPDLPNRWRAGGADPGFPRFTDPPEGGVTAWYTMRLNDLANGDVSDRTLPEALAAYTARDAARVASWTARFGADA
ncbi:oxidoreductase [Thalassococcus sp. BH17M4-6]|uniref:oxidoreductase n=1 Tax=Thalassococcus sp. BH17M4-6 TaxID=3413148 RepID=UPI003BCDFBB3